MCGIFGGIGNNLNTGIIRALAIANRERGKQSFGLFDSSGKAVKAGIDPYKALANAEFAAFVNTADRWFLAGHTRHATHGKINDTNAHPFRFGRIIGAHNGVVHTPHDRNYQVDSEYLFDQLNRHDGNYQAAFADIPGYWGLSWFDGSHFYLQAHSNEVAVGLGDDNNYYYSSDSEHLAACTGRADKICVLSKGRTMRFANGTDNSEAMPDFVTTCTTEYDRWSWRQGFAATTAASSAGAVGFAASAGAYNARQLPQHYRESKSERKRRKRQEKIAAREGYGVSNARINHDEFDLGNIMAQECGYRDLADFMWREDCQSESAAIRMLRNEVANNYGGSSLWSESAEDSNIAGLDTIPF